MSDDNTQGDATPSLASAGCQPAAYDVVHAEPGLVITRERRMDGRLRLTAEERAAMMRAMYRAAGVDSAILWSLLERTK